MSELTRTIDRLNQSLSEETTRRRDAEAAALKLVQEVGRLREALERQAERHEREHKMLKVQLKHIVEKAARIDAMRPVFFPIDTMAALAADDKGGG